MLKFLNIKKNSAGFQHFNLKEKKRKKILHIKIFQQVTKQSKYSHARRISTKRKKNFKFFFTFLLSVILQTKKIQFLCFIFFAIFLTFLDG